MPCVCVQVCSSIVFISFLFETSACEICARQSSAFFERGDRGFLMVIYSKIFCVLVIVFRYSEN